MTIEERVSLVFKHAAAFATARGEGKKRAADELVGVVFSLATFLAEKHIVRVERQVATSLDGIERNVKALESQVAARGNAHGGDKKRAADELFGAVLSLAKVIGEKRTVLIEREFALLEKEFATAIDGVERSIKALESTPAAGAIVDCGVFRDGTCYAKGSAVTRAGSLWIARRETAEKPGTSDAWRLAVKRGHVGTHPGSVKLLDAPRAAAN